MNDTERNLFKNGVIRCDAGKARLYIKRLFNYGYESDWVDVSQYVISFPRVKKTFGDEQHLGKFKTTGSSVSFINTKATFSDESNPRSIFSGAIDRVRTKVKMEVVIFDQSNNEHIVDRVFYYVYGDIKESDATVQLPLRDLLHSLTKESCDGVTFTQGDSLSEMIGKLLKKEVNGGRIFDSFLEGATDSERYVLPSSNFIPHDISDYQAILSPTKSIWSIISRYCLFLNGYLFVNDSGNFELNINREIGTVDEWHFNYLTSIDEFGSNVRNIQIESGIQDIYNTVYIVYGEADTDIEVKKIDYNPNNWASSNSSKQYFLYGEKKYQEEFHELGLNQSSLDSSKTEVEELADRIFDYYSQQKTKYIITHTPCILKPLDKVILNAQGRDEIGSDQIPIRLGSFVFGDNSVFSEKAGAINILNKTLKVISSEYDINTFTFKTICKEEI